ncbi:MAG: hypothetical protein HXX18_08345 [Bacteroidetes bacterium]|nr:hypothetical protein [Bacteroidota bacterium]
MNISKDNYEIYILDYYEGKLNESQSQELLAFVDAHPDVKAEFDAFENISLTEDTSIRFEFKECLKKEAISSSRMINVSNYQEFFIADSEGDLSILQKNQLEKFRLLHPNLNNEYHLFQLTKLSADKTIVFENKHQLKKFSIFNIPINKKIFYQTASIAASLLLMASVATYYFSNNTKTIQSTTITTAENNKTKTIVKSVIKPSEPIANVKQNKKQVLTTKNKRQDLLKEPIQNTKQSEDYKNDIPFLASIHLQKIDFESPVLINDEHRNYYTSINDLLAFADDQIDNNTAEKIIDNKKNRRFDFDTDLLKNQPIAEAGSFLKNAAIIGFSKIEAIGSDIKNTYVALEKKVGNK